MQVQPFQIQTIDLAIAISNNASQSFFHLDVKIECQIRFKAICRKLIEPVNGLDI